MASVKFCDISNPREMVFYLQEVQRFNNTKYVNKYTKLSAVVDMFSAGLMLINNPKNMNDKYEYDQYNHIANWSKVCFSSFILGSDEKMAMWSMYAQPWTEGVMMSIPMSDLLDIVNKPCDLFTAVYNKTNQRYSPGEMYSAKSDEFLTVTRVAYVQEGIITCTGRDDRNKCFKDPYNIPEFAGHMKDSAWDYEREVRLRADLPDSYDSDAIYVKLPESFLMHASITTGPRFEGNVLTAIPKEYRHSVEIKVSKFKEKLAWIPCDSCERKRG